MHYWFHYSSCASLARNNTVFTRISAAALIKFFAPPVRCLFEGGAYLKFGRHKESNILQLSKIASFECLLLKREVALAVLAKFAAFTRLYCKNVG